jgi:hypothetical protein
MVKEVKRALQLPKQQLLILGVCRFAEPVAMTSVYPYIVSLLLRPETEKKKKKRKLAWF